MKQPLYVYIPLAILIALMVYVMLTWKEEEAEGNVTYLFQEPRTGIFDDVELADKAILDKLNRGEPLSAAEWEEVYKQQIRLMEKIDAKAARLQAEYRKRGQLTPEDQAYLSEKIKELNRVVLRESPGRPKGKRKGPERTD